MSPLEKGNLIQAKTRSLIEFLLPLSPSVSLCSISSWPTIPQVYLEGEFVGGCDIMLQMHQSGELEKMLVKAKLVETEPGAEA